MKLLLITQVLDQNDSDLGFFVRWVEEFAKHFEVIEVICLRAGQYTLPAHVRVHVLGKGKLARAFEVMQLSRSLQYDSVFVHMNPEYVVAAGWLWRLMEKKIVLWYTHKSVDLKLRIAAVFAYTILSASKESFRLSTNKLKVMGHGIDTTFFSPDPSVARGEWWLSVGRLSESKRHDLAIRMAHDADKELRIGGEGPKRPHLEALVHELGARVVFLGPLTHTRLRDEYRKASLFIHTSETGSLDKVVLEALACGLPVRTNDQALKFLESADASYVRDNHSLGALIPRIVSELL